MYKLNFHFICILLVHEVKDKTSCNFSFFSPRKEYPCSNVLKLSLSRSKSGEFLESFGQARIRMVNTELTQPKHDTDSVDSDKTRRGSLLPGHVTNMISLHW